MNPGFFGVVSTRLFSLPGAKTSEGRGYYCSIGHDSFSHRVGISALLEWEGSLAGIDGVLLGNKRNVAQDDYREVFRLVESVQAFSHQKGAAQGVCFNAHDGRLLVHGDFGRQRPVFYYHSDDVFIFASGMRRLVQIARMMGIVLQPDESSALLLLTYSSIPGEGTLLSGFKKLPPACSIEFRDGRIRVIHRFDWMRFERTVSDENKAIDLLQDSFAASVQRMAEYNTTHDFAQYNMLSGGIDSRMVLMGTLQHRSDAQTICFSKKNYLDELISAEITRDFGLRHRFIDLGNGEYMLQSQSAHEYDGTINYLASAHHRFALQHVGWNTAIPECNQGPGIVFSGQLGNELLHDFYAQGLHRDDVTRSMASFAPGYASTLQAMEDIWLGTPLAVQFKLLNRAFVYTNSACYSTTQHAFLMSPFVDPDFISVALSLHPHLLSNHRIYLKWMARVYPQATKYRWERYACPPRMGIQLEWAKWATRFKNRFYHKQTLFRHGSMSPIDYWHGANDSIRVHFDSYVSENLEVLSRSAEARRLIEQHYAGMNVINKAAVYTLLHQLRTFLNA